MKGKFIIFITLLILCNTSYAQLAKIPFEFYENKHILLKLKLNDAADSILFYFDTGATATLLDSATSKKLGLVPNYKQSVQGAGGAKIYNIATNQKVNLFNNITLDSTHIIIDNLSRLQASFGRKFDGIIGYSILEKYITKIDYDHKVIELYDINSNLDTSGYSQLDFEFGKDIPIPQFPITIEMKNGKKLTDKVFFDSGAGLSLLVNTPYKLKNNLETEIGKTITSKSNNLSAISIQKDALIKSLQIGKYKFGENVISLASDKDGVSSYDGYLGILGNVIISRFNLITDYQHKCIYIKPNSYFNKAFEFPTSGIGLKTKNNVVQVNSVIAQSEAYSKGLRENDTIISIDGVEHADISTYRDILKKQNKSVKIKFLMADGATKEIEIKLKRLL